MDTKTTRVHNLLFLLAAAPAGLGPLACELTGTDDDGAGTGSTPATAGDTGTGAGGTTMGVSDGTAGPMGTTMGGGDTTVGGGGTTMVSGGEPTAGTTGEPPSEACTMYAATVTACYDEEAGAAALLACAEYADMLSKDYGMACLTAYEDFYVCLAGLDCKNFGPGTGCEDQLDAFNTACFKGG
jgi:hypothetical protein